MRTLLACLLLVALAGASLALTPAIAPNAPTKATTSVIAPPADPDVLRQGGDTIADAVVVPGLPFNVTGTTVGYVDDYDETCPFGASTSPDVVYAYTPTVDVGVNLDLCGSSYDTKIYVYDDALQLIACNDDFYNDPDCGAYTSFLENVPQQAGVTYYWIIDGYTGDAGDYVFEATSFDPCVLECPPSGVAEGEPPLQDDQLNAYNDGCGSDNPDGFQILTGDDNGELILCGGSGFFLYQGSNFRDTDWFIASFGPAGTIEVTADAERPLYVFELGPQDCNTVGVLQQISVGPCATATMTITGAPDAVAWIWAGPTDFASPDGTTPYEFDYTLWISGLAPGVVATEARTWGEVKSLFH